MGECELELTRVYGDTRTRQTLPVGFNGYFIELMRKRTGTLVIGFTVNSLKLNISIVQAVWLSEQQTLRGRSSLASLRHESTHSMIRNIHFPETSTYPSRGAL